MATKKKLLQAAAGSAGGAGLNVEDVFSTYLYDGTGSAQTITNGIDLDGEGGMVWIKSRTSTTTAFIYDTERGATKSVTPSETGAQETDGNTLSVFNTNGFSVGTSGKVNSSSNDYASWTFRKAPKFFDVVTYTGDGTSSRNISHNLGTTVGFIIIKSSSYITNWSCYHRELSDPRTYIELNKTDAQSSDTSFFPTAPTDTQFTVGSDGSINGSGRTYVAYLFAHNDGDGEFGPDADADIIKCGSYTGGTSGIEIDLGFEPQWLLIKSVDSANSWFCVDNMRGFDGDNGSNSASTVLRPNSSGSENTASFHIAQLLPNGFTINSVNYESNASGEDYIYIAIRRGPMGIPESASEVFSVTKGTNTTDWTYDAGFPVDTTLYKSVGGSGGYTFSRLTGSKYLRTDTTDAETSYTVGFDNMSFVDVSGSTNNGWAIWDWKRAPNYFDVVAYTGNGTAGRTVSHNLGVAPEMMWVKSRSNAATWVVYHKDLNGGTNPEQYYLRLDTTGAEGIASSNFNDTAPTASNFTLGVASSTNGSGQDQIAYLFASLDGVSKVGSYTGNDNGSNSQVIDCGFSSGARFVLIKVTSTSGDWYVFDTERGIVAGDDPYLLLNTTGAEQTVWDGIDPHSSGFEVRSGNLNVSGETYIFYAIA